jgi:protein TonB
MNIFNPSKNNLDEIVFENRNKMYGAYALRKDAAKYTNLGMVYALSPLILLALIAIIYGKTRSNNSNTSLRALTADSKKIIETAVVKIENLQIVPDISFEKISDVIDYNNIVRDKEINKVIKKNNDNRPINSQIKQHASIILNVGIGSLPTIGQGINGTDIGGNFPTLKAPEKPFDFVEIMPEFPGGMQAMYNYITNNLQYPKLAKESNRNGRVVLSFVVNADGSISDINIMEGIGFGCDDEAKRVISEMPNWKPGIQNGTQVSVRLILPINFTQE